MISLLIIRTIFNNYHGNIVLLINKFRVTRVAFLEFNRVKSARHEKSVLITVATGSPYSRRERDLFCPAVFRFVLSRLSYIIVRFTIYYYPELWDDLNDPSSRDNFLALGRALLHTVLIREMTREIRAFIGCRIPDPVLCVYVCVCGRAYTRYK